MNGRLGFPAGLTAVVAAAVIVLVMVGLAPAVSAQVPSPEAPAALAVTGFRAVDADGRSDVVFPRGERIAITLTLRNTGTVPATGIRGTLTFPRGIVLAGTAAWPDLAPGAEASNTEPFVFSWDEPGGAVDPRCHLFLDPKPIPDALVDDVDREVVRTDEDDDPSDDFEPIPPGSLTWDIAYDLGELRHVIPFAAACSMTTRGIASGAGAADGGPRRLAATGAAEPALGIAGALLIAMGVLLRRRAAAPNPS